MSWDETDEIVLIGGVLFFAEGNTPILLEPFELPENLSVRRVEILITPQDIIPDFNEEGKLYEYINNNGKENITKDLAMCLSNVEFDNKYYFIISISFTEENGRIITTTSNGTFIVLSENNSLGFTIESEKYLQTTRIEDNILRLYISNIEIKISVGFVVS